MVEEYEEEEKKDETELQDGDPKAGLDKKQLKRMAHEGTDDHVHKLSDGTFTSGSIPIESGGHVHTYNTNSGLPKRTSISEDIKDHVHESEKGPTGIPE